jgi:hypothetical protein
LVGSLLAFLTTLFAARRARGFAAATFFVNAFWTDPALAAIAPSVAPIDSATLVRIASSFDDLWLSTVNPFADTKLSHYCISGIADARALNRPASLNHSNQHNYDRQH